MNNKILFYILATGLLNLQVFSSKKTLSPAASSNDQRDTIIYPVIPGDFADPSVIRSGNIYYAAGTSSEWAPHYPLFTSTDLKQWKQAGYIFPHTPSWASASFWAPELFYHNGTYFVYYTARKKADNISCIGVATSKEPMKGFTDQGIVLEFGKEAIDAFITESEGKLYMSFKAYGLDDRPIELLCYELSNDGLKTVGEPFMLLRDDNRIGLEGQCLIRRNNYFYLFYSAGNCCGRDCSYQVHVARSATIKGPYIKYDNNPVLSGGGDWKCTGHGTVVQTAADEDYYLSHAYSNTQDVYTGRQGMLSKITWNKKTGWPSFSMISGTKPAGFKDDFTTTTLQHNWQWDFRHAQPEIKTANGTLSLSGATSADNITGTALTVRPFLPDYEISTGVINHNTSLKGLVVYGDAGQAAGIGISGDSLITWYTKENKRTVLHSEQVPLKAPVYLKIGVRNGNRLTFYWSDVAGKWKTIAGSEPFFNADFLPPWDRSPRPGLLQQGAEPAVFDFFEIRY